MSLTQFLANNYSFDARTAFRSLMAKRKLVVPDLINMDGLEHGTLYAIFTIASTTPRSLRFCSMRRASQADATAQISVKIINVRRLN
jgi:hypothetical protein